mmetsp:Transcript_8656/g.31930  ORF Transcript_8656/g.31930 Transcript_8656/m.31930 type:complete len:270 (-) Transcript_8656:890-1699(-)
MHVEDAHTAALARIAHLDDAVHTALAQQRVVQNLRAVGGAEHEHLRVLGVGPVHLHEQLDKPLLALVVVAAPAAAALAPDGVDLVDEHDARLELTRSREQVAYARGRHALEHLHELRPTRREEGHPSLSGNRLCQVCLSGSWRAVEQHASRQLHAAFDVLLLALQHAHDFVHLVHDVVETCDVAEGHAGLCVLQEAGPRLAQLRRELGLLARLLAAADALPCAHSVETRLKQGEAEHRQEEPREVEHHGWHDAAAVHEHLAARGANADH